MAKGFFITGTDTGVGKTIIAGALIKVIEFLGLKVCGMKPVESGCGREGDVLIPYDGMFLKQLAHMEVPIKLITPCCLESPLAPLIAAEIDGKDIHTSEIEKAFNKLSKQHDAIVVEGIGGLMVPIKKDYFVTSLAKELGLPLIIVAKPGIGTINHIMLTVTLALREGLDVAGVILNYTQPPENSLAEETNPKLLEEICPVPIIGIFPYLKNMGEEFLQDTALRNLNLEVIKKYLGLEMIHKT